MSRGDGGDKLKQIRAMNHFYYFKLFYKYIKDYQKDLNFLYYEMKDLKRFIFYIKESNMTKYIPTQVNLLYQILQEKNISSEFENFIQNVLIFFKN